jgi:hypothetical protein
LADKLVEANTPRNYVSAGDG